jgi:iron uptake system component EfeO
VNLHSSLAIATAALAGLALTSCQAKEETKPADPGKSTPADITVTASDTACELSGTEASTGPSTFVITNNGTKVTEFYVYGEGERVMGEVENISPGLQRKLIVQLGEPGTYQTACKPGMVGDGIRAEFKVTGESVKIDDEGKFKEASDNYKRYVNSQTDALIAATQIFVDAVKKGDIPAAKAQFPTARTYYERIEPVAESFPNDLDPRIDLREADGLPSAGEGPLGDRPAARHQRDGRPADGRRQGTQ